MRVILRAAGVVLSIVSAVVVSGCGSKDQAAKANSTPRKPPAVPVTVASATQKPVPIQVTAIGNVQPYSTVQVKAQVGGELIRVGFVEGQDVHKGDLLFVIDPRSYEASLAQAEANLARDQAQFNKAQADARRFEELYKSGIIAQEQYEQYRTTAEALASTVKADQAAIESAKLQVGFTTIRSPIDGRTGNLLVHEGNLIKANDVPLVIINQIQPVFVAFSVPAENLDAIRRYMASRPLPVKAIPRDTPDRPETGRLTFVDNNVDVTTGTIQLKGTFPNARRALWPGQFVDVVLTLTTERNAVVVPSQAVQTGQQGQYVFVVKPDMTVESRAVKTTRTFGGDAVIDAGLQPGERVITDGQLRLTPGARVVLSKPVGEGAAS